MNYINNRQMRIIYLFIHLFMENASKTPYTPQSCAGVLWRFFKKNKKKTTCQ